jgi:hypothetical protein
MKKALRIVGQSLLVGTGYMVFLMFSGMILRMAGLSLPEVENLPGTLMWTFVGGAIAGLFLGPIASSVPVGRKRHIVIWSSAIFFNLIAVAIEGYFFAPQLVGDSLTGIFIQLVLTAVATGSLITILFTTKEPALSRSTTPRSTRSWAWRFIASVLSYVFFYFFFGAISYELVTKPYYENHAGGLTVPSPDVVLVAEIIRGSLIVLSVLPFLYTLHTERRRLALLTGLILFSIGGLVPLTMQGNVLPIVLLSASAVEIFFQNFSTGVVLTFLLGQSNEESARWPVNGFDPTTSLGHNLATKKTLRIK